MSELKARNSSELKSFTSSELKAFSIGGKLLFLQPPKTEISMVWSVEFIRYNVTTDTVISRTPGTIILHDRWFHVTFSLMASVEHRGICSVSTIVGGQLDVQAYSAGTPEPVDGLHEDGNLTLVPSSQASRRSWRWTGTINLPGDPSVAGLVVTGTTVEFTTDIGITSIVDATPFTIDGIYTYDPNVLKGAPHDPNGVDKWIMFYCDGAGGLQVSNPMGGPDIRVLTRIKCVITV